MKQNIIFIVLLCLGLSLNAGKPRNTKNPNFRPREKSVVSQLIDTLKKAKETPTNTTIVRLLKKAEQEKNSSLKNECLLFLQNNPDLRLNALQKTLLPKTVLEKIQKKHDTAYLDKHYPNSYFYSSAGIGINNSIERTTIQKFLNESRNERIQPQWYHVCAVPTIITIALVITLISLANDNLNNIDNTCTDNDFNPFMEMLKQIQI